MSRQYAPPVRIAVYCGANLGARAAYGDAADLLGTTLAERGHDLVYGGGHVGLMGRVADAVLSGGGRVTGVITEHLMKFEQSHEQVTDLIVVPDMPTRKREMFDRSDAFIALPGGVGTLEELFEVLCWRTLGLHEFPVALLEVEGYWAPMVDFLHRSVDEGFLASRHLEALVVTEDPTELFERLGA